MLLFVINGERCTSLLGLYWRRCIKRQIENRATVGLGLKLQGDADLWPSRALRRVFGHP